MEYFERRRRIMGKVLLRQQQRRMGKNGEKHREKNCVAVERFALKRSAPALFLYSPRMSEKAMKMKQSQQTEARGRETPLSVCIFNK